MKTKPVECGQIIKHNGRLCEVVGYTTDKNVFLKVLFEQDKDKCPHCGKPVETEISEVENCLNWIENVEAVKTAEKLE